MSRKLTAMQSSFVKHLSKGAKRSQAARLAGFSNPHIEANRLMRLPHVLEELHARREAELKGDMAQAAMGTMRDLLGDDTPAATRYQAARWVLKHAGHETDEADQGNRKALEEMNADELAQAVSSGMTALQELAGQLQGTHYVEGEARQVQDVQVIEHDEAESADFLD